MKSYIQFLLSFNTSHSSHSAIESNIIKYKIVTIFPNVSPVIMQRACTRNSALCTRAKCSFINSIIVDITNYCERLNNVNKIQSHVVVNRSVVM